MTIPYPTRPPQSKLQQRFREWLTAQDYTPSVVRASGARVGACEALAARNEPPHASLVPHARRLATFLAMTGTEADPRLRAWLDRYAPSLGAAMRSTAPRTDKQDRLTEAQRQALLGALEADESLAAEVVRAYIEARTPLVLREFLEVPSRQLASDAALGDFEVIQTTPRKNLLTLLQKEWRSTDYSIYRRLLDKLQQAGREVGLEITFNTVREKKT